MSLDEVTLRNWLLANGTKAKATTRRCAVGMAADQHQSMRRVLGDVEVSSRLVVVYKATSFAGNACRELSAYRQANSILIVGSGHVVVHFVVLLLVGGVGGVAELWACDFVSTLREERKGEAFFGSLFASMEINLAFTR